MEKKCIDISAWQGNPDFEKIKASGVEMIILRAGCGRNVDKSFYKSAAECERLGIPYGIYWFIYAVNETESEQNAIACLNVIKSRKLSLPVFADEEYDSESYCRKRNVVLTKDLSSRIVKKFLDTVAAAGYRVGNYTNLDWYRRFFDDSINKNPNYDLWFAYWGAETPLTKAAPVWQYSSKGKVAGIAGDVDMDIVHKDYIKEQPTNPVIPSMPVDPDDGIHKIPACYRLIFDPDWYLRRYEDLQKWITECVKQGIIDGSQEAINWQLLQHFYMVGMEEIVPNDGIHSRYGASYFNVVKYKAGNPELQDLYGDISWKPYYMHYMLNGAGEIASGKRAKIDLTV